MRSLKRKQAERIWYMMCESSEIRAILEHEGIDLDISEKRNFLVRCEDDDESQKPASADKRRRAVGDLLMEVRRGIMFGK